MPYSDDERQREAKREWARRQRKRLRRLGAAGAVEPGMEPRAPLLSVEVRLRTVEGALALLENQIGAVIADERISTLERARCVTSIVGTALRAVELVSAEQRIDALERLASRSSA